MGLEATKRAAEVNRDITATISRADVSAGQQTNENRYLLSFSSEEPVLVWGEQEILDHSEGAVDLTRLNEIGVILFNHNRDKPVARIENAWIENNRGQAYIIFDNDNESNVIRQKVESGTLKGVSVSARVSRWEVVEKGEKSEDGRFEGPAWIAKSWTPVEVSIVSVPADMTVGVNRSENNTEKGECDMPIIPNNQNTENIQNGVKSENGNEQTRTAESTVAAIRESERQRALEISQICREFNMDPTAYIENDSTVDMVRAAALEEAKKLMAPANLQITRDESDKIRTAAVDGMLMRGGVSVDNPAAGANDFRGMSIRSLMDKCARQEGIANPENMDVVDLLRAFYNPSSAFPAILDMTLNKAYLSGYNLAPTTFDIWTSKGVLTDFKTSNSAYRQGDAGELLLVPEGGELKSDLPKDEKLPQRKLGTYGRQFTMSREAIINDDIGVLTSKPSQYAAAARRTLNKQVYTILAKNTTIYDGTALFSEFHKNLVATGSKPNMTTIQEMIVMLALMKNNDGNPIAAVPRYIIVPVGLGDLVQQIVGSPDYVTIDSNTGNQTHISNPLGRKGLIAVEDAYLNTLSENGAFEWYLAADKTILPAIQVDYLNGQEVPSIRRMESPGQLGYSWDIFMDWGITVTDYRGIIKNKGK